MPGPWAILPLAVLCASVPSLHRAAPPRTETITHYAFTVPDGYTVKDVSRPMLDFKLIRICKEELERGCLGLYFGNAPNFPDEGWRKAPSKRTEGTRTITSYAYEPEARRLEGLIEFSVELGYRDAFTTPYSKIHYFSYAIGAKEAEVFEEIVRSVVVVKPRL